VNAISFRTVLCEWHPDVIRLFLRYGADYKTDSPFAEAFVDDARGHAANITANGTRTQALRYTILDWNRVW